MKLRERVEEILARADAISWESGEGGGTAVATEYADRALQAVIDERVSAAEVTQCHLAPVEVIVDDFTRPPTDDEAENMVAGFLLILQPNEPTRCRRLPGVNYCGDYDCTPARIWRDLSALDFADPFRRWLFDAMRDASRRTNWVAYLSTHREHVKHLGPFAVSLKRLGDCVAGAHWCHLPYWIDRVQQASRRRADYYRGRAIVRASIEGLPSVDV